jgi:hypothetical protein
VARIAVSEHAHRVVACIVGSLTRWVLGNPTSQVIRCCKLPNVVIAALWGFERNGDVSTGANPLRAQ